METIAETPAMNRETLTGRLQERRVHDHASASQAIDQLHERGMIAISDSHRT